MRGSRVERLVSRLHDGARQRGVAFRPPVYLSDQWGCPDGTPVIGVPFYLADARLERIEAEQRGAIESDEEAMRYLRHEAGHAFNYAFRLHERAGVRHAVRRLRAPIRGALSPPIRCPARTCATSSAGTRRSIPTRISPRRSPCGSRPDWTGGRSTQAGARFGSSSGWTRVMREIAALVAGVARADRRTTCPSTR